MPPPAPPRRAPADTTVVKVVLLVVVAIVGYTAGSASNMEPFLNPLWEEDGVFLGSSILFFCYVGFDALGTAAEEVGRRQGKHGSRACMCMAAVGVCD